MRFFHVGDLHFGKMLHNVPLIEEDQPFWVEQLLAAADEYQPDAVVIAGDVYDRQVPPPEAMRLFDHMVTELSRRGICVLVIPGNHDSAARLSHVSGLLTSHNIYIAGDLHRELRHVTLERDGVKTCFWLMPYIFPKLVADAAVLGRDDIQTYDQAARALLLAQETHPDACNVLVAHQNVLSGGIAPEHSGSETIIGGLGEIGADAFDGFDYVALGHIHNAQPIGRETIRYSGCPLYYDFSETDRRKDLTMVTVGPGKKIEVSAVEIPLRHRLARRSGTLADLLAWGEALEDKDALYVQCILEDAHLPYGAMEQLQEVFGDCLVNIKREPSRPAGEGEGAFSGEAGEGTQGAALSVKDLFGRFISEQTGKYPDRIQDEAVEKLLELQERQGGELISDHRNVPAGDSQEIADLLLGAVTEEPQ